jgi:hypothetical protein
MPRLPVVPENDAPPVLSLSPSARLMALYILAASRTGKSRLMGRGIVWSDYYYALPQIVIDSTGIGTIDNFLDKLIRRLQYVPKSQDMRFLRRIRYVNMASTSYITPFPLLYATGKERSLLHIAERYINVIRMSYPALLEAQVQGFPPLHYIAVHTHIVLAALGLPITNAEDLLRHPEKWQHNGTFVEAIRRNPACAPSVAFFQEEFIPARPAERRRLLNPYFEKIFTYNLDVNLRCQFGALKPGIDWEEVEDEEEGLTVLIDCRDETDPEGTYLFGRATLPDARILADVLFKRDPMRVKHVHTVWGKEDPPPLLLGYSRSGYARYPERYPSSHRWEPTFPYYVLDREPRAYFSLEEQQEEVANWIADLGLFEFLCRPAISEGEVSRAVIPVSIANLDRDGETGEYQFPDYERVARFRSALEAKDGIPAAAILKELESALPAGKGERDGRSRREQPLQPPAPKGAADGTHEDTAHPRHHQRRRQLP